MHLYRSKITLDRLKRFFNAFRRNCRWVPLPIVWIASARLHLERKRKLYRYFVNGTTQSRSCFRCQKNTSTIWRKFSTEISVKMVSVQRVYSLCADVRPPFEGGRTSVHRLRVYSCNISLSSGLYLQGQYNYKVHSRHQETCIFLMLISQCHKR